MAARKNPRQPKNLDEERLKSVLQLSSDWYWEQDRNLRFTLFSGKTFGEAGFESAPLIGKTRWEIPGARFEPGERAAVQAKLDARQPFVDHEYEHVGADGLTRYISASGVPVTDASGRFAGYRGTAKDITERKRAEKLRALEHAVNRSLAEAESAAGGLMAVIRDICEIQGWECGRYFRVDEKAGLLRFAEAWSVPGAGYEAFIEKSSDVTYSPGVGLTGLVWQSGRPVWSTDATTDPRVAQTALAQNAGTHGAFIFPVVAEGKVMGALVFSSLKVREPDERLLQAVQVIGSQIGQFLKRIEAQDRLRASEAHMRSLSELSSDLYWEQDDQYRFTSRTGKGSERFNAGYGIPMGSKRWERDYLNMTAADWPAHIALLDARQPFHDLELCRLDKYGKKAWISVSGEAVFDPPGTFKGYRGVGKDITERKRAEELQSLEHSVAHRIAEAESVTSAMTAVIRAICETESWECGRYFRVDEEAGALRLDVSWGVPEPAIQRFLERSYQWSREIVYKPGVGLMGQVWMSGQPLWVADATKDARAVQTAFTIDVGIHGGFIFPVISEGKTIGVLAFNSRQVREPDERLLQAILAIGGQIGQFMQRKRAEEEQRRFRVALDNSADMIVLIDRATMRFVDVNETVCRLLGYSREELLKMGPQDLLPLNQAELEKTYDEFIRNPSNVSGMRSSYRCKDGTTIPFESTRRVLRSGDGYLIAAISRDIREHLAAEEAQREQLALIAQSAEKDRLLTLFYELPFVGLAVTSPSSKRWLQVNDYMCEMLGYPREELLQLAWTETTHPDDLPENLALFKRLTAGEFDSFQFDKRFLRKDGGIVDTTMEVRCVRRGDGSVETVVIMVRDITERKLAERANVRLGRMFAALSATNDAILHAKSVDELYRRVCDAAVHGGNFSNTTIFLAEEGTARTKVMASAGRIPQQLQASHISVDETIPEGRGLVGIAFRTQRPCVSNDFLHDARTQPWHEMGRKAGCRAAAAFPLVQGGRSVGAVLFHHDELNAFDDEIVRLLESMAENVSFALDNFEREVERKRVEVRIQHLASHDALTSLPNRVMFSEVLNMAIESARHNNRKFAVLFIDLDRFKVINDTLGHEAGDKLLQEMGTRIKDTVRTSDVVARLGGDEFVVLVQEVGELAQVEMVARKILSVLIEPMVINGQECRVSASVGICMYPADAQTEQSLMKNADTAMYHAKEAGKNTYRFYSRDTNVRSLEGLAL